MALDMLSGMSDEEVLVDRHRPRFKSLTLTNFLSFKKAHIELDDLTVLVGPNASGKSNFVSALNLLREIGMHSLPVAIARQGGFDQLRYRSKGRPTNPALKITFSLSGQHLLPDSSYEIAFSSIAGGTYKVKKETATIYSRGRRHFFSNDGSVIRSEDPIDGSEDRKKLEIVVPPGQSALNSASYAGYLVYEALSKLQTVEINPKVVRDFQEPSSLQAFEPDGSNVVAIYDSFPMAKRRMLVEYLAAIVPGIAKVEVSALAGQQTLTFGQSTPSGVREFTARQMSDGTLRAFAMLVALFDNDYQSLIVLEEPEIAIHLGAINALVDILATKSESTQLIVTTHSADVAERVDVGNLRIVWSDGEQSNISNVAAGTAEVVRDRLLTVGDLMRAQALDPELNS